MTGSIEVDEVRAGAWPHVRLTSTQREVDSWRDVRRILCVRLDNMGDVLMSTPAMRALRRRFPRARITLLTSPPGAALKGQLPEIDDWITVAAPWVAGRDPVSAAECVALVERLRAEAFDVAVIFASCTQSPLPAALLCWLAGIPRRLAHCRENPYHLLSHRVRELEPEHGMRHEVLRQLSLVAHLGARLDDLDPDDLRHFGLASALPDRHGVPLRGGALSSLSFSVSSRDRVHLRELLHERLHERPVAHGSVVGKVATGIMPQIVIHPGASAASRRWPAERFSEVARKMIDLGWPVVLAGGRSERALAETVARGAGAGCLNLAGELSLGEFGALLQSASLLVANNSGPAHVAAALGTPVVVLYALTNPQHVPWQVPCRVLFHEVPCRGCLSSKCPEQHHHCLLGVTPEQVVAASVELIGTRSAPHVHAWH